MGNPNNHCISHGKVTINVDFDSKDRTKVPIFTYENEPIEKVIIATVNQNKDLNELTKSLAEIIGEVFDTFNQFPESKITARMRAEHSLFEKTRYIRPLIFQPADKEFPLVKPLFALILESIFNWEEREEPEIAIQKGTAFFWMAEYYLDNRNIDTAFQYFAQAIEEDKRAKRLEGKAEEEFRGHGAYMAVSLTGQYHHASDFKLYKASINKLKDYISDYQTYWNSSFSYEDFQKGFLNNKEVDLGKAYFTRTFLHLCDFMTYEDYLYDNFLISSTILHYLFGLTLVFEKLIVERWPLRNSFRDNLYWYIVDMCHEDNYDWAQQHKLDTIRNNHSIDWEKKSPKEFKELFTEVINLSFKKSKVTISEQSKLLMATALIRNMGAHALIEFPDIAENFEQTSKIICQTIFLVIETLYL